MSSAIGSLTMARYRPSAYEVGTAEESRERVLAGLLQSAVLKRFESCWAACLATVQRMIAVHAAFLEAWDVGAVPSLEALRAAAGREAEGSDAGGWLAEVGSDERSRRTVEFEPVYREHVAADLQLLRSVEAALAPLSAETDPKLAVLAETLRDTPGKVAVFASYGETISYLDAHLDPVLGGDRERVVIVGGTTTPDERTGLLARFCPDTVVEPGYLPPDGEVDLLLSTDVVSEGQNLQQAGAVVSYDMPWNPQRVVQRNGRVIRLLSPHATVTLTTMLPERGELEELLRLEARIQAKIAAAGVFGMESAVLDDAPSQARNYYVELEQLVDRLDEGDAALLDEADGSTGSFAGEQLRALLMRAAAEGEVARLQELPWGVGASFRQGPRVPSRGAPGTFFACRTRPAPVQRYWRFVRDDEVDREELPMLRVLAPGQAAGVELPDDVEPAWRTAVADIVAQHNLRSDPAAQDDRLPASQRWALSVLRDPAVVLPPGADEADELLAVPRDAAVRSALTELQRGVNERRLSRDQAAEGVMAVVGEFGLTPVPPPPVLTPITEDDVGVVCWMRVLPSG